jgi:hypothetical protein
MAARPSIAKVGESGSLGIAEAARIIGVIEATGHAGRCFFAMTLFTASGLKPLEC